MNLQAAVLRGTGWGPQPLQAGLFFITDLLLWVTKECCRSRIKCIAISNYNSNTLCLSTSLLGKLIVKDGDSKMRVKKEINIQIGEQIKMAREKALLTQEQFAEHIDVSPQYVSDLERGVVGVSISTLKRICTVLGVSSDQILFGIETENRAVAIAEKCGSLAEHQYELLSEIVSKFVEAVASAASNSK